MITPKTAIRSSMISEIGSNRLFNITQIANIFGIDLRSVPFVSKLLMELITRQVFFGIIDEENLSIIPQLASPTGFLEIPFLPTQVIMQDYTAVPVLVDLASMRDEVAQAGGDPELINPVIHTDVIIDHSIQVDTYGTNKAYDTNMSNEFDRNIERYEFLRWAERSFSNLTVYPPGSGIIHQLNMENITNVITNVTIKGENYIFPEIVLGTDSHTTMINGLGVLGWGVGGIEAESVMLGQPTSLLVPEIIGVYVHGTLNDICTPTDLVLYITEILRTSNVTNCLVEFFGPAVHQLSVPDRATIANMAPEFGATIALFPVDYRVIDYLRMTGRQQSAQTTEEYFLHQNMFKTDETVRPNYSRTIEIDISKVTICISGPKSPDERMDLSYLPDSFREVIRENRATESKYPVKKQVLDITDGAIAIAAITSCTNTSNPYSMIAAGLLAKKAVERGLQVPHFVKTSLAPGSKVVTRYLRNSGLLTYLEQLGYFIVGYGCTTCSGSSGPLSEHMEKQIMENGIKVAAVLSGNRNFPARIHPLVQANYLASPALVVALSLAGTVDINLLSEPIGKDFVGNLVYLDEIWPSRSEIELILNEFVSEKVFQEEYRAIHSEINKLWDSIPCSSSQVFPWNSNSTYIQKSPFFDRKEIEELQRGARILALYGDKITTDHISPAGQILTGTPAGIYLDRKGVEVYKYNTFGSRRGAHELMIRGAFSNVHLINGIVPSIAGGWTKHFPTEQVMTIFDACMRYSADGVPLVIFAGEQYGSGSSRDWAAKALNMLGVKVVFAKGFERIHRSNLVRMGILPIQLPETVDHVSLGLKGDEVIYMEGIEDLTQKTKAPIIVNKSNGERVSFQASVRLDTEEERQFFKEGGILPFSLKKILKVQGG